MHSVPQLDRPTGSLTARSRTFALLFESMAVSLSEVQHRSDLTPQYFLDSGLHHLTGHQEDWSEFRASCNMDKLAAMTWEQMTELRAIVARVEVALTQISRHFNRLLD